MEDLARVSCINGMARCGDKVLTIGGEYTGMVGKLRRIQTYGAPAMAGNVVELDIQSRRPYGLPAGVVVIAPVLLACIEGERPGTVERLTLDREFGEAYGRRMIALQSAKAGAQRKQAG